MPTPILVTGASGYFGGTFFQSLMASSTLKSSVAVFALVRTSEQAESVKQSGATPVLASLDDKDIIKKAIVSNKVEVVVHLSDSFSVARSVNLLEGLHESHKKHHKTVYFLTVFGGSSYADTLGWPENQYPVVDDTQVSRKEKDAPTSEQRRAANAIREAAERLGVKGAYANVCLAFGIGTGFGHRFSTQLPTLVKEARSNRSVHYIGAGEKAWSYVHVQDIANFFMIALEKALSDDLETGVSRGNYFLEAGHLSWKAVADALAAEMHRQGLVDEPEAKPWSLKAAAEAFGYPTATTEKLWASQTVTLGQHSRAVGWRPAYDVPWLLRHLDTEIHPERYMRLRLRLRAAKAEDQP